MFPLLGLRSIETIETHSLLSTPFHEGTMEERKCKDPSPLSISLFC